jgi:quinol monooxygenase YgiN
MMSIRRCPAWFAPVAGVAGLVIAVAIMTASAARAQAGPDTVYALTTFDVSPSATLQTIALLKQYRDAARKQAGNISVDLLQETGLLNRFAIHESWSNRSAYDANEKAPQMTALRDGLKPFAGAPLDRRTYRPLSIGPTRNAGSGSAVYMVLFLDVFPISMPMKSRTMLAGPSQKEAGALRYDVYEEPDPHLNHFPIVATWTNEKAYEDHEAAPYTKQFRAAIAQTGQGNLYDQRICKIIQ